MPRPAASTSTRPRPWNVARGSVAATATLIIHALLIGSVVLGTASQKVHLPNREGAGASAVVTPDEPVMTMININDPEVTDRSNELPEPIASRGFAPSDLPIQVVSPDATPAPPLAIIEVGEDAESPTVEATGDEAGHALMFGRYMGQVTARIERAWLRPRDALDEPVFRCSVQIAQSKSGDVKEITLQDCNGTGVWQASLVAAIQSASPLPAPPDPFVFADALTLTFEAVAYREGGDEQGYEPRRVDVASYERNRQSLFESLGISPQKVTAKPGVIELRVVGKPSTEQPRVPANLGDAPAPEAGTENAAP